MGRDDDDSYPVAVVAAGSAAKNKGVDCNCFNLITVGRRRIQVKSVFYGGTREPRPDGDEGGGCTHLPQKIDFFGVRSLVPEIAIDTMRAARAGI